MIDFLLGVPGKLATISTYLTTNLSALRAAKIDNLDAAISTRAPASTALTNATWTDTLATKISTIAADVVALKASVVTPRWLVIDIGRNASLATTHYTCPTGKTAKVYGTAWAWSESTTTNPTFQIGTYTYTMTGSSSFNPGDITLTAGQTIIITTVGGATTSVSVSLNIDEMPV